MPKKECLEAPQCRRVKRNCPCGVLAKYGLVPSELGVGLYCGHTVDRDIVSDILTICTTKYLYHVVASTIVFLSFCRVLGNVIGSNIGSKTRWRLGWRLKIIGWIIILWPARRRLVRWLIWFVKAVYETQRSFLLPLKVWFELTY